MGDYGQTEARIFPHSVEISKPAKSYPSGVPVDLAEVRSLADFKVIEIIDDNTLYPALLGIDFPFENQAIINLKKKTMSFEGNGIRVIGLLDPTLGPRYT